MTRPARAFWVVAAGVLLLELAWMIALPAFRGMDETEHVFRADSLVGGQLLSRTPAPYTGGSLVAVRPGVAEATRTQCEYNYPPPNNCSPQATTGDGRAVQASTAASYNPLWYAVVGPASLPFDGAAADVAMRLVSAVVVAALVGWSAALLTRWDSTGWMIVGLLLAFTPTVAYSGAVAAPNAVGYGAALLFWSAILTLVRTTETPPLVAVVTSTALVAHTHTTGLLWLTVGALALLALRGPRWWARWFRAAPGPRGLALGLSVMACATALAWIRFAHTNSVGTPDPSVGRLSPVDLLGQVMVWAFQTIGAFPNRHHPAPLPVYALWLMPTVLLLVVALRRADRRHRRVMALLAVCWTVIPVALTLVSYSSLGFAWQGRYTLPLVDGILLLAASCVAGSPTAVPARVALVTVPLAFAHAWSAVAVTRSQAGPGLGYAVADHLPHTDLLVLGLALAGGLLPAVVLRRDGRGHRPEAGPVPRRRATQLRAADRNTRLALAVAATSWGVVPLVLTLVSYRSEGFARQGRPALPLFSRIVLLAARAVARQGRPVRVGFGFVVVGAALGYACSAASVVLRPHERAGSFALSAHLPWAWLLVAGLALVCGLVPLTLVVARHSVRPTTGRTVSGPSRTTVGAPA